MIRIPGTAHPSFIYFCSVCRQRHHLRDDNCNHWPKKCGLLLTQRMSDFKPVSLIFSIHKAIKLINVLHNSLFTLECLACEEWSWFTFLLTSFSGEAYFFQKNVTLEFEIYHHFLQYINIIYSEIKLTVCKSTCCID